MHTYNIMAKQMHTFRETAILENLEICKEFSHLPAGATQFGSSTVQQRPRGWNYGRNRGFLWT